MLISALQQSGSVISIHMFSFFIFLFFGLVWFIKLCLSTDAKIWNASRICVSSLRRGHADLLCIVPILVYVLPKRALFSFFKKNCICLSLAVLGPCCCAWAFSRSGEWGLLFVSMCGGSLWWFLLSQSTGFRRPGFSSCVHGLSSYDTWA